MPRIIGQDSDIVRRMFWESSKAVGSTAIYHELAEVRKDIYNDPTTKYCAPIVLEVLFDENPKVKMLRDFGWFNEDEEIRPLIVYLPIYRDDQRNLLNVQEHALLELVYMGVNKTAWFRITAKRLDSLYGNYWICKCAPERKIVFIHNPKDGYDYLSLDRDVSIKEDVKVKEDIKEENYVQDIGYVEDLEEAGIVSGSNDEFDGFFNSNIDSNSKEDSNIDSNSKEDDDEDGGDSYSNLIMG